MTHRVGYVIDDATPMPATGTWGNARGLEFPPRDCSAGYDGVAAPWDDALLIDPAEWPERIRERKAKGLGLYELMRRQGFRIKFQNPLNYCWVFAVAAAAEVARLAAGESYESLSPASVGAPVKGWRNIGGWGKQAVEYAQRAGFVPSRLWPDNVIDRRLDTEAARQLALAYRPTEWLTLVAYGGEYVDPETRLRRLVSMLLRDTPCPVGYTWWGHEVCAVDVEEDLSVVIANSWSTDWGDEGYGRLQGGRRVPDDCVALQVMTAA